MKRNKANKGPYADAPQKRDTARRIEMEFGVAAEAYRSDPGKRATRNGALALQIALAVIAFAVVRCV